MNLAVTAVSLTIEWDRGWNGGLAQTFYMSYLDKSETIPDTGVHYEVKLREDDGIRDSTEYTVSLYAENTKGPSTAVTKTATTKGEYSNSTLTCYTVHFTQYIL